MQHPATSSRLVSILNVLRQALVRPSAPKPAFVCSSVEYHSIQEASDVPLEHKSDEFEDNARLVTCRLDWAEDARHFRRSLTTASKTHIRRVAICSPEDIDDADALVDCIAVLGEAVVDVHANTVTLRSADPLFVFGQGFEQLRVEDVPGESLWLVDLARGGEGSSKRQPDSDAEPDGNRDTARSSVTDATAPHSALSGSETPRRKEPGIYRAFRIAVLMLYLHLAVGAAAFAAAGIVTASAFSAGSWQWAVTTAEVVLLVLSSLLLVAIALAFLGTVYTNAEGYFRVELPRKIREKRVPRWTATTSRCLEDGVRIRGGVPVEVWRRLAATKRENRRAANKARRTAAREPTTSDEPEGEPDD